MLLLVFLQDAFLELLERCDAILSLAALLRPIAGLEARVVTDDLTGAPPEPSLVIILIDVLMADPGQQNGAHIDVPELFSGSSQRDIAAYRFRTDELLFTADLSG